MEGKEIVKEYSNDDITVVWKPQKCIHSANCVNGLPSVFKPNDKPWIQVGDAEKNALMETIDKCPSGALTYRVAGEDTSKDQGSSGTSCQLVMDGPLIVTGPITLVDQSGSKVLDAKSTAFCRCGASENKPFCDGKHKAIGFKG